MQMQSVQVQQKLNPTRYKLYKIFSKGCLQLTYVEHQKTTLAKKTIQKLSSEYNQTAVGADISACESRFYLMLCKQLCQDLKTDANVLGCA